MAIRLTWVFPVWEWYATMKIILTSFRWAHTSVYSLADLSGALHGIRNWHAHSSQAAASTFQSAKNNIPANPQQTRSGRGDPIPVGCCSQSRAQGVRVTCCHWGKGRVMGRSYPTGCWRGKASPPAAHPEKTPWTPRKHPGPKSILYLKAKEPFVRIPSQQLPPYHLQHLGQGTGHLSAFNSSGFSEETKIPLAETPQASIPVTAPKVNTFALFREISPKRTSFCLLSWNKYSLSTVPSSLLPTLIPKPWRELQENYLSFLFCSCTKQMRSLALWQPFNHN